MISLTPSAKCKKSSADAEFELAANDKAAEVELAMKQVDPEADEFVKAEGGAPVGNQNAVKDKDEATGRNTASCSERKHTDNKPGILRRLARAASGQKSRGVVPTPERQAQCQELLRQYAAGKISVNQAAIASGLRKVMRSIRVIRALTKIPARPTTTTNPASSAAWPSANEQKPNPVQRLVWALIARSTDQIGNRLGYSWVLNGNPRRRARRTPAQGWRGRAAGGQHQPGE